MVITLQDGKFDTVLVWCTGTSSAVRVDRAIVILTISITRVPEST